MIFLDKKENKRYQKLRIILESYLSNQYSYIGLSNVLSYSPQYIQKILVDYSSIDYYFGTDVLEELKHHKEEMKRFSLHNNNLYGLDSIGIQLRVLLKNSFLNRKFTSMEVMSLKLLRMCYLYQGNLELISKLENISIDSLLAYLSAPFLRDVLTEEANHYLNRILAMQNLYNCQYPTERKNYLEFLFSLFHQCNGNLLKLQKQTGHSISVLRTIFLNRSNMLLANQSEKQREWILKRLKDQVSILDDLTTAVEEQILVYRHTMCETYKNLDISNYQVKKLVCHEIPKRNPVRGMLVKGVLSTLDS